MDNQDNSDHKNEHDLPVNEKTDLPAAAVNAPEKPAVVNGKMGRYRQAMMIMAAIFILAAAGAAAYIFRQQIMAFFPAIFKSSQPGSGTEIEVGGQDLFAEFSKLVLPAASAEDNFELTPVTADSAGVAGNEAYILRSKEKIPTATIAENLTIEPAVGLDVREIGDRQWRLEPQEGLEANTLVRIALDTSYYDENGGQKERDYAWAFQVKDSFKVLRSIPRDAGTNVPANTGIEVTFSHENFSGYEQYFSITPAVPGKFEIHGRTLVFVPNEPLAFRQVYTVTVKAGLPLKDSGEKLAADHVFSFETEATDANRLKWSGLYLRMLETTSDTAPVIKMSSYRAPASLKAKLFRFVNYQAYLGSIREWDRLPWWSYSKDEYIYDSAKLKEAGSFDLPLTEEQGTKYAVFPHTLERGYYLADLYNGGDRHQVWIQVSDLSAYYNITKTDTVVWVNNSETGAPEANATIEVLGTALSTRTGNDGLAVFTTPEELKTNTDDNRKTERYYLKIANGRDEMILPASRISLDYWWEKPAAADDYWIYLYTDRPRYQTTDKVKYWGFLKRRDNQPVPGGVKLILKKEGYVDYYYRPVLIAEEALTLSGDNSFSGEVALKDLKPDYYTLSLQVDGAVISTKYLSINPYVKPAFSLSLSPDREVAYAGDTIKLLAKASFFEGTPLPGLELVYHEPGGEKNLTTDENGEIELSFTKSYTACANEYGCWPDNEYFSLEPKSSELGEITADTNLRFYGPNVYTTTKTTYPSPGQAEIVFETKFHDLAKLSADNWWEQEAGDQIAPNVKIEGEIIKITYTKKETGTHYDYINKKSYKSYEYIKHEEKLKNISFASGVDGEYVLKQAVEPETTYRVKFKTYDEKGRYENDMAYVYYYNGRGLNRYSNWSYNYYHFVLPEGQESFSVGDTVVATFYNNDEPLPNRPQGYLFLQLQNGLKEYAVGSQSQYRFVFAEEDIPNVNLAGVYFNGSTYETAQTSYYGRNIDFDYDDRRLKIEVKPDKEKYQPGEKVDLGIFVTDKDGRPLQAEVNLNLVDEAYYAVANDTASPLETIYASIRSGSLSERSSHESLKSPAANDMAERGGCFAAGTTVLMADGRLKPIEEVKEGDIVRTLVDPIHPDTANGEVTEVWQHRVGEYLLINHELKVTPEHQMYSNHRFIDAGLLKAGDWLLDYNGKKVFITSIETEFVMTTVYNLRIDPQHTFFAGGFYVHNQEKGGGPREFFTDAALFQVVKTGADGRAETKFDLPDNITSWRVTAQGITGGLYAGVSVTKLPVSLPVFAEVTVGSEYLIKDKPVARMRAFGTELKAGDPVEWSLAAESLGLKPAVMLSGLAFKPAFFTLPALTFGRHDIIYSLDTAKGKDAIKLPLDVIDSRLSVMRAQEGRLAVSTVITAPNSSPFTVVLSDLGRSRLYGPLLSQRWSWGDRVDQKYNRLLARRLLNQYYDETEPEPDFRAADYQTPSGGIALLPYSSEDLELTVKIALAGADGFDKEAMAQYFFEALEDRKSNLEEVSFALCGLAALSKGVLPKINDWIKRGDLSLTDKLFTALAFERAGAAEESRAIYRDLLKTYGVVKEPQVAFKADGNADSVFKATALGAMLAADLNADEAYGLLDYLVANQILYGEDKNSENLYNLEKLAFAKSVLAGLKPSPAKVELEINGERKTADLTGRKTYAFELKPEQAKSVKFLKIDGEVGFSLRYTAKLDAAGAPRDDSIGLKREYFVNGAKTDRFKEDDLIEVRLYPQFRESALTGDYQITDILPSGLAPITKLYARGLYYDCHYWFPYNNDGQTVKYMISSRWRGSYCGGDYFRYYARVRNKGTYAAEPAVIQSFVNPEYINYSNEGTVTIN